MAESDSILITSRARFFDLFTLDSFSLLRVNANWILLSLPTLFITHERSPTPAPGGISSKLAKCSHQYLREERFRVARSFVVRINTSLSPSLNHTLFTSMSSHFVFSDSLSTTFYISHRASPSRGASHLNMTQLSHWLPADLQSLEMNVGPSYTEAAWPVLQQILVHAKTSCHQLRSFVAVVDHRSWTQYYSQLSDALLRAYHPSLHFEVRVLYHANPLAVITVTKHGVATHITVPAELLSRSMVHIISTLPNLQSLVITPPSRHSSFNSRDAQIDLSAILPYLSGLTSLALPLEFTTRLRPLLEQAARLPACVEIAFLVFPGSSYSEYSDVVMTQVLNGGIQEFHGRLRKLVFPFSEMNRMFLGRQTSTTTPSPVRGRQLQITHSTANRREGPSQA